MKEEQAFESWLMWYSCVEFEPYDTEFTVYGKWTAGTCDTVGMLTYPAKKIYKKVYYIDWKSSLYSDRAAHGSQIAKYKQLDGRFPKAGIAVLHLDKDLKNPKKPYVWVDYSKYEKRYRKQFELWRAGFYNARPQLKKRARG